jgi:hypothetical protein
VVQRQNSAESVWGRSIDAAFEGTTLLALATVPIDIT